MDLSFPILLAAFSLCTSLLALLGTVQLVVSAPQAGHHNGVMSATSATASAAAHAHQQHMEYKTATTPAHAPVDVGIGAQKRFTPLWGTVSPTDPSFVPLESRPPLSMAKLIMLRHAESQRRANARARTRLAQAVF